MLWHKCHSIFNLTLHVPLKPCYNLAVNIRKGEPEQLRSTFFLSITFYVINLINYSVKDLRHNWHVCQTDRHRS